MFDAEAEVEARNWEKRNSDIAFREINQEFESPRYQLHQASTWADQAQRDKNRLFQEDHARDCQEIEELSRICCEETDQARQVRIEELPMQQQRNPTTLNQMMAQIRDLQKKVNSLPCSDSGLPRNTQICTGIMGNVFERPRVQEGQPSTFFHNSKNLASSSQLLGPDTADTARKRENGMKRESLNTPIQSPHFQSRSGMLNHTGGTYSHNGMVDYPRASIAELNLGKLPVPMEFQGWKTNFRTESCLKTADPQVTMHWIKEVEIAKSIDELKTSRSIVGRTEFPDFDMHDAMLASALKKILITRTLPKKRKCRRAASSKIRPVLTRNTTYVFDL